MRDLREKPYSLDERRVAQFFSDAGTGGGDDPIGSLIASHMLLASQRNKYRDAANKALMHLTNSKLKASERIYDATTELSNAKDTD